MFWIWRPGGLILEVLWEPTQRPRASKNTSNKSVFVRFLKHPCDTHTGSQKTATLIGVSNSSQNDSARHTRQSGLRTAVRNLHHPTPESSSSNKLPQITGCSHRLQPIISRSHNDKNNRMALRSSLGEQSSRHNSCRHLNGP